jgi:hypothetical protein
MMSPSLTAADVQRVLASRRSEFARLGVHSLAVFGSVARGEAGADSDIDFLVEFTDGATLARYMELKLLLETIFQRRVDLVTQKSLRSRLRPHVERDAVRVA